MERVELLYQWDFIGGAVVAIPAVGPEIYILRVEKIFVLKALQAARRITAVLNAHLEYVYNPRITNKQISFNNKRQSCQTHYPVHERKKKTSKFCLFVIFRYAMFSSNFNLVQLKFEENIAYLKNQNHCSPFQQKRNRFVKLGIIVSITPLFKSVKE